jgi:hypothetical protein
MARIRAVSRGRALRISVASGNGICFQKAREGVALNRAFPGASDKLDSGAQTSFRFPPQEISLRWYGELPPKYWSSLALSVGAALTSGAASVLVGTIARRALILQL